LLFGEANDGLVLDTFIEHCEELIVLSSESASQIYSGRPTLDKSVSAVTLHTLQVFVKAE